MNLDVLGLSMDNLEMMGFKMGYFLKVLFLGTDIQKNNTKLQKQKSSRKIKNKSKKLSY